MSDRMRDPMIGLAIGRFVIREKLAEGGMGAVYLAVHERLGVRKVVKVLLGEYSHNPIIRRRFEREATAASRLSHRHVIRIDDFGALPDGQLFLVMPFLDGETLEAHLRHTRPSLHHTCHVLVQLCAALQHLHEAGIVHRDLKPGNVFLSATAENPFEVVLIDLGIARDRSSQTVSFRTQSGIALGTPGYMAVEQYGHAATADARADVYATAVIAWEMLTGQLPWGVHDARVLHLKQMTEPPSLPDTCVLPADLVALLAASLAPDPAARPRSARDFAIAFAAAVPAAGPREPSGADIVLRFARDFVERAPADGATVRCAAATPATAHALPARPRSRPVETTLGAATGARDRTPVAPTDLSRRPIPARRSISLGLAIAGALAATVGAVVTLRPRSERPASVTASPREDGAVATSPAASGATSSPPASRPTTVVGATAPASTRANVGATAAPAPSRATAMAPAHASTTILGATTAASTRADARVAAPATAPRTDAKRGRASRRTSPGAAAPAPTSAPPTPTRRAFDPDAVEE